jgi:hypothetical protein
MRTVSVLLSCLVVAFLVAPAAAEDLDRVVAGLSYRLNGGPRPGIVQVVRVRHEAGRVFVRHADGSAEWVDAKRLAARPQPIATDAGPYLFVAAALACLLDEDRCALAARPTTLEARPARQPSAGGGNEALTSMSVIAEIPQPVR